MRWLACLIVLSLSLSCQGEEAQSFIDHVRISYQVNGSPPAVIANTRAAAGAQFRELMNDLDDNDCFIAWSAHDSVIEINNEIIVSANNVTLVFNNITLKATDSFTIFLRLLGDRTTLMGLNVDANGDVVQPIAGVNSVGIGIYGRDSNICRCEVSEMPDHGHCYHLSGENCHVSCCKGINPGYTCFRTTANFATYDQIEAFIDRSTENGQNRLFGADRQIEADGGLITLKNSHLHAEFAQDYDVSRRQVVSNIDPGNEDWQGLASLVIENCLIEYGPSVVNSNPGNSSAKHAFKIVNVEKSILRNVTVKTHENFGGWTMRLAADLGHDNVEVEILDCDWDSGINFDGQIKGVKILNSRIGVLNSPKAELFEDTDRIQRLQIENCLLRHKSNLFSFLGNNSQQSRLILRNSAFESAADQLGNDVFVFRGTVPLRPNYLTAHNFFFLKTPDPQAGSGQLWLANSPLKRLALTPNNLPNSYLFSPSTGVSESPTSPTSNSSVYLPPFDGLPGSAGTKIILEPGISTSAIQEWRNATYWQYDGTNWNPVYE